MRFVVANDSFKGTLDQLEAADLIAKGIERQGHTAVKKPMSDGGDGLLKCVGPEYKTVSTTVVGPEGQSVNAKYKKYKDTAIIESAEACGLHLVTESLPGERTTFGVGELILHAAAGGAKKIIIGLGGTATSDGGYGLFKALGGSATDIQSIPVLSLNKHIDLVDKVDRRTLINLSGIDIIIASDVKNSLLGPNGAVEVFGPQKGILKQKLHVFENRILKLHEKMIAAGFTDCKDIEGAGAAGGLGWMLLTLGAKIEAGGPLVADLIELDSAVLNADFVITGEGRTDTQTMQGKVPAVVLSICQQHSTPCILLSGDIEADFTADFYQMHALVDDTDRDVVMTHTSRHLVDKTETVVSSL